MLPAEPAGPTGGEHSSHRRYYWGGIGGDVGGGSGDGGGAVGDGGGCVAVVVHAA